MSEITKSNRLKGIFFIILSAFGFAVMSAFIKLSGDLPNIQKVFFRNLVSAIIALFGASSSVLKFEDIRVQKEMNGKVNRIVNCQTANLNKTLNASVEQIDAIRRLQQSNKFNNLDDNLKEIALLRLEYPDMSLVELGKKLKEPLGKSGVNYRLKRIIKIAEDL